jgi:hypothetical protein
MERLEEQFSTIFQDLCLMVNLVTEFFEELVRDAEDVTSQYNQAKNNILAQLADIKKVFRMQPNPDLKRAGKTFVSNVEAFVQNIQEHLDLIDIPTDFTSSTMNQYLTSVDISIKNCLAIISGRGKKIDFDEEDLYEIPNYSQVDEEVENVIRDLLQDAKEMTNNQSFTYNFDALNEMIENSAQMIDITLGDIIAKQPSSLNSPHNTSNGTTGNSSLLQVPTVSSPTGSSNNTSNGVSSGTSTANSSAQSSPQLERGRSQVQLAQRRSIPNLPPIDSIMNQQGGSNNTNTAQSPTSANNGASPKVVTPNSRSQSPDPSLRRSIDRPPLTKNPSIQKDLTSPKAPKSGSPVVTTAKHPVKLDNAATQFMRKKALDEVLKSESEYVIYLILVNQNYLQPLKQAAATKRIPITEKDVAALFSCFESVCKFHQSFLKALEINFAKHATPGEVFKKMAPMMKVYTGYIADQVRSTETLRKFRRNTKISNFLDECKEKSGQAKDLEDLLDLPYQRLDVYENLLQSLISLTPKDHPDYKTLEEAQNVIHSVNQEIQEKNREREDRGKILEISNKITGMPPRVALVAPHRVFFKEGPLEMKQSDWKKQRASSFFVFLFNDMVLVTKKPSKLSTSRRFAVEAIINLHETHLDHGEEDRVAFSLYVSKKDISYTFYAEDHNKKKEWFETIERCLHGLKNVRSRTLDNKGDDTTATKLKIKLIAGKNMLPSLYDRAHLVVIFRVGENVIESKVKTANDIYVCNPLWDEEFVMEVSDPSTDMLRVTVKDTSSDRILGKTKIVLSDLYEYVPSEKWYTLKEAVNIERPGEISLCLTLGEGFQSAPAGPLKSRPSAVNMNQTKKIKAKDK